MPPARTTRLPLLLQWTGPGRAVVFVLSATSIWCLLAEMYHWLDMRTFFYAILLPATAALYAIALLDRSKGDGTLFRAVMIGTIGGLVGAVAYNIFRLPFVFSHAWGLERFGVPQLGLFKVFPRFGALILGEPMEQGVKTGPGSAWGAGYSLGAHLLGWAYHFSNGATFGVMFSALIGEATHRFQRGVPWAVLMAMGIEAMLLLSPYAGFFDIKVTPTFVVVTLTAHLVFGVGLGLYYAWHARQWRLVPYHRPLL